ncbi:short chain dehydrogenase [Parasphingorhabdus marina DSM 22363]|uniref:Short chain dehydrogenase n=1 Tax=Parasphingorhabdus marina DSM 22363 TaxID=1123272 RepID=A0A1N6GSJ8_9SPHN|nr:SDR family NAD(P)-dependent oxidoreductase [Parasphingorhabdus marina]SIO10468.1 short chain dehydrogenase [Parasphingorhabdus marina DSM 22363]
MPESAIIVGAGASNGVGGALARQFASQGLHAIIAGRTEEKVQKIAEEISADGGSAEGVRVDVTSEEDQDALFALAAERGPIGAVLYNAGNNAIIPFEQLDAKTLEDFWRVGCFGAFLTAKRAIPVLRDQGKGSLFFTGASGSMRGKPNFAHFASMKAGLRMLAQSLAREFGPHGVHVAHFVIDGVIDGDMVRSRFGEFLEQLGEDGCLRPEAIAEAFWHVHIQHRSAWTHELDLRPFKENW